MTSLVDTTYYKPPSFRALGGDRYKANMVYYTNRTVPSLKRARGLTSGSAPSYGDVYPPDERLPTAKKARPTRRKGGGAGAIRPQHSGWYNGVREKVNDAAAAANPGKSDQDPAKPAGNNMKDKTKLDEELPKPNSDANPSNLQVLGNNVGNPLAANDDTPNKDPGASSNDRNDSYVPPLIPNTPRPADPNQGRPVASPETPSSGGTTATLTVDEFRKCKEQCFAMNMDCKASAEEMKHRGRPADPGPDPDKKDTDPSTTYVPLVEGATVEGGKGKGKKKGKNKNKDKDKGTGDSNKAESNDKLVENAGPPPLDKGLLGLGALLGTGAIIYGVSEGIESQYVVGAAVLTTYCYSRVLNLSL